MPDGAEKPYELNITYYSALAGGIENTLGARRFLCSQALMLAMKGIPGIYIHSLTATENDMVAVEATGINRRINRRKWQLKDLRAHLRKKVPGFVFETLSQMIRRRSMHSAFHPDSDQKVLDLGKSVFAILRSSVNEDECILCLFNFTGQKNDVSADSLPEEYSRSGAIFDILRG